MKTLLILLLLACGAMAQDCAERQRLEFQYYLNTDGTPLLMVSWGPTECTNWTVEVSQDMRQWGAYTGYFGAIFETCSESRPDYCVRLIIERAQEHRQQFYRLRLAPAH